MYTSSILEIRLLLFKVYILVFNIKDLLNGSLFYIQEKLTREAKLKGLKECLAP